MLYMASPVAGSAIKTPRTNAVGLGLKMNPKIDREFLHLSPEEADRWEKKTKAEFALWADDKRACDATGMNNFYAMQQLAFVSWLVSGDVFVLKKMKDPTPWQPYSLRLHIIEADRCATPEETGYCNVTMAEYGGNMVYDGVEVDRDGMVVAYHFRNKHPYETTLEETKYTRVLAYGEKTGLPNVLHIMNAERPEQYRGVTYLAQIMEPLLQTRRYTESEITAALVESFFSAFIKTVGDAGNIPIGEVGGFAPFMKEMCTQMGAALEIPRDVLMKEYNSSYSASRGAMLEAWKAFRMYRGWFVDDFCKPVYGMWMEEAVARGRIAASGFFSDPLARNAWLGCEWIGPSQGQLDPVKEVTAEIMSVAAGFSTYADSSIRVNGSDWNQNMDQIRTEEKKMQEAFGETGEKKENRMTGEVYRAVMDALGKERGQDEN